MSEQPKFRHEAAKLIEQLAFAIQENIQEGDDPTLPMRLMQQADILDEVQED